ncbi:BREX system P-loop protein BrxC, partial [Planctomycetota bacterium]
MAYSRIDLLSAGIIACLCQCSVLPQPIVIKLPENTKLRDELWTYLKTEKYIARKNNGNPEIARILRERKDENRTRKTRLMDMVKEMLTQADFYAAGQTLRIDGSDSVGAFSDAVEYLIENTFTKMGYIEHPCNNPQAEIQSVLRANDIGQQTLNLTLPEYNPKAVAEVREYVSLCTQTSKQIVMHELITKRFHNRPYGWPEWETVLILARLIVASEIHLIMNGAIVESKRVYELISKTSNWRKITIKRRKIVDKILL